MRRIVTHAKPDADAIAAAWLAETFMFPGEDVEVVFVPRLRPGQPCPAADCVVDIAGVNDPERLVFDHKPPAFADRNATCATRLVWEHLLSLGRPVAYLEALVRDVHEGDRSPPGRPSPDLARSRSGGFHFQLKQARAAGCGDDQLYRVVRGWLDRHDREEQARCKLMRSSSPNAPRATPADVEAPDERAGVGGPKSTSVFPGDALPKRTTHDRRSIAVVPPSRSSPTTSDDGLQALESLLLEYGRLCQRDGHSGPAADADRAGRVAAIRGVIVDQLVRSEPGSKAAAFLRGLRVLVEVERIAPGHLGDRRRGADGWWSPLSHAKRTPGREASERVALEYGVGIGKLEGEVKLAEAVEVITGNCGVGTLKLLLTPGGRLGVSVVLSIARKGPERQRYAMAEAALGRDPMARPAPGVWPMDTRNFEKVPGRLGRALGAVESCTADVPALLARNRPSGDEIAVMRRHLEGVVEYSGRLLRALDRRGEGELPGREANGATRERPSESVVAEGPVRKAGPFARVRGRLNAAHYFVEKTARDVVRLPTGLRPTPRRASQIRGQLLALIGLAGRLIEIIAAGCSRPGP